MNIKNIRALAQILENSGLTALEVAEGDSVIRLEKSHPPVAAQQGAPRSEAYVPVGPLSPAPVMPVTPSPTAGVVDFNDITEIKSPMVGIFYNAPTPDAAPFVKIGDKVKKGDVLCIIEAMKLMNEFVAESDGEVVDICAQNGQLVEFGQCLFKIF